VAVIGASKNPVKGGNWIMENLVLNNFPGVIYPVNPNSDGEIFGLEFKKSVLDIEDEVDIAICYVPNRFIPGLLKECVEKGIKGAIVQTAGFEEVGKAGLELRDEIRKITDNFSKIRIVGPNCIGVTRIDGDSNSGEKGGFFSGFSRFEDYKRGNIAVLSQSGMLNGGYLRHLMTKYPDLGFRYSISIGNKMDLSEIEFLEYFLEDPTVNVIALYLESFKDPRKFIKLCRKAKKIPNKTIILVKGGSTTQGQKASLSHTGSLSEDSKLIDAVIKQAGVLKANNFSELFQFARTFSMMYNDRKKFPTRGKVSIIFGSGGAGTMAADLTMKYDLTLPVLGDSTYENIKEMFPEWMPPNRFALIDLWPTMEKAMRSNIAREVVINNVYQALLNEPEIEGVFYQMFCSKQTNIKHLDMQIEEINKASKPTFIFLIGDNDLLAYVSRTLSEHNIPNFSNLEEMVKSFWMMVQDSKNRN
jgi:acetyltransferase